MKIFVAKTSGFCFGVDRAVKSVEKLIAEGKKVCTLGPLIHNDVVTSKFERNGVITLNDYNDIPKGYVLVIRSHGVSKNVIDDIERKGINYIDYTCPFVKKIHKLVENDSKKGNIIFIAGDRNHPEVIGINGYCSNKSYIFKNLDELKKIISNNDFNTEYQATLVSQTTFNVNEWKICTDLIKKIFTNIKMYDTICNTTQLRQKEAEKLSKISDAMLVIGDKKSSNTNKLYDICKTNCKTYFIGKADDLPIEELKYLKFIGITAGASTPGSIIEEVKSVMLENANNESFEAMLEESLKNLNTGSKVKGTVVRITPTEVYVDIGRKHLGIIPKNELSTELNFNTEDVVSVGDELDLLIMKTDDQEGTIMLSKNRIDARKGWNDLEKFLENGNIIKVKIIKSVNGGLVASYKSTEIFIPASQVGGSKEIPFESYVNKEVEIKVTEINKSRRRVIGSIKLVSNSKRKEELEKFWNEIEVGKQYRGKVKSITSYGVFVDLGCIDAMIHVSDLSWSRVNDPHDIVSIGQELDVRIKKFDKETSKVAVIYKKEGDNPWNQIKENFPIGTVFETEIISIMPYGAFAKVIPGVDGLIHVSQISDHRIESPKEVLSVGDKVKVKVRDIDDEKKKVSLTMKDL